MENFLAALRGAKKMEWIIAAAVAEAARKSGVARI